MIVNYNCLSGGRDAKLNKNVGENNGPPAFSSHATAFKTWFTAMLVLLMTIAQQVCAQSSANYLFATGTAASLAIDLNGNAVDMSTGTTQLVGPGLDATASANTNIGFDFAFMGKLFNGFAVQEDGILQLGTGTPTTNTYTITGGSATAPRLSAFCTDFRTGTTTGKIHYKVVGTAPNRSLIVEFKDMQLFYTGTAAAGTSTWQMRLYENGTIEYVYGTVSVTDITTGNRAPSIGFYTGATTGSFAAVTYATHAVSTTSPYAANPTVAAVGPISELTSATDGSRRFYRFTPATIAAPTGLNFTAVSGSSITLNWTDVATAPNNEIGYAILRSTDNVNFTAVTTTAADATSYVATGLSFGTLYYWRVHALREALSTALSGSQATPSAVLSGVKTVGTGGDYANLTAAFAAINNNGLAGSIELQLVSGYPAAAETYPIVSSIAGATGPYSVKVYPTVSGLSITSANATGTLNLNNAKNITIDGRVNQIGTADLIISNTNAGASYAVQFANDATSNTIQYCSLRSRNNSTTSGTVVFGTSVGLSTGNDGNTIANCDIRDDAGNPYLNGIYAAGTTSTTALYNDNNNILNNNIYNYFSAGSATNGVLVAAGNGGWTISGNSFYQTAPRTYTSGNTHSAINVSNSSGGSAYTINNNFIGGSAPNAGGTAYVMDGAVANLFRGITLSAGTASASNIQGNVVRNFAISTTSSSTNPGFFAGINVTGGLVNVGTVTGNTIGAATGTGSIVLTSTTTGGGGTGIYVSSSSATDIRNNTISSISTTGGATIGYVVNGIYATGSPSTKIISNNTIGSATANAITVGSVGTTATATFYGIYDAGSPTTLTMNNNTVRGVTVLAAVGNLYALRAVTSQITVSGNQLYDNAISSSTAATSASLLYGYYNFGSPTIENINGNQIYNLSMSVNNSAAASANFVAGIYTNTVASAVKTISGNVINNLAFSNSGSGSATVYGIRALLGTTQNIFKNKVYAISAGGTASIAYGFSVESGTTNTIYNNLVGGISAPASGLAAPAVAVAGINIPATVGTNNVYNNTVYLSGSGGTNFGSAAVFANTGSTLNLRNNILVNAAAANGTGKSAAFQRSSTTLTSYASTSNQNLYYAGTPGANNVIYFDGTNADQTLVDFKTRVATRDAQSITENPAFLSTTGAASNYLHINPLVSTYIESGASPIAVVTDDFDGDVRNAATPDIGADEFAGTPIGCSVASGGTATAAQNTMCLSGSTTISAVGYTTGNGITYQWQSAPTAAFTTPTNIGSASTVYANLATGTINTTTHYRLKVVCTSASLTDYSSVATVTVNSPSVTNTTPGARCGVGTVSLAATAMDGTLNWYSAPTGGNAIGTGSPFVTPSISATTTFYVGASGGSAAANAGKTAPASTDTGSTFTDWGIVFDVLQPLTLTSVNLYSTAAGTVNIKIMNASLTTELFSTGNVNIAAGGTTTPNVVPLNFDMPIGTGYRILVKSFTGVSLVRGSSGVTFPYNSPGLNVTASEWGGTTTGTYYYFYNLAYETACTSARTPVVATVNTPPAVTLSSSAATICANASTNAITLTSAIGDYDSYVWSPSTNVTGNATSGYVFNPTASTVYTLTAAQTGGSQCVATTTFNVTVVELPTFASVTASPASICSGEVSTLSGIAPNGQLAFNAVSGASLNAMAGATTVVASGVDDLPMSSDNSAAGLSQLLPFPFKVAGVNYTYFSASPDGWVTLKNTNAAATSSFTNTTTLTSNVPKFYPYWDDMATGTDGYVKTLTTGTAPNRIFIVEWFTTIPRNVTGVANSKFQAWFYEASNSVEYRYGAMGTPTSGSISAGYTLTDTNYNSITFSSNTGSSSTPNDVNTVAPAVGTQYTYAAQSHNITWSPIANLYTDLAATVPYTGTAATKVYAKLIAPATYTATATTPENCTATQTVSVSIGNPPVQDIVGPTSTCLPFQITLTNPTPTGIWSSSNTDVATINASGVLTPVAEGSVVISYSVTVLGCTTTKTQMVAVNAPVSITDSTPSQSITTGANTTFSVTATGTGNPTLTYQWYVDETGTADPGAFVAISDGGIYSGSNSSTLSLTNVPEEYLGYFYYATVTGVCNAVDSSPAILLVGDTGVTSNPVNVTICESGPGTASFSVTGSADVTSYEWQEDQGGDNWMVLSNGGMYSGVDTPTLSLTGLGFANNGWRYKCVVYGIGAAESTPATLTVIQNVIIASSPAMQAVCYTGGVASYSVAATGGIASYDWQYSSNNGASWSLVSNGTPTGVTYTGASSTNLTVTTTAATPASGTYSYRALVNGASPCAATPSAGAQLVINNPTITAQPTAATASAITGAPAVFTVSATTYLAPTYQWQYATTLGGTYTNVVDNTPAGLTYTGANSATLNVTAANTALASTARYYRVIVSSGTGCSVTSNGAQLTVTNYCTPAMATVSASGDYLNNFSFANITNNGSGDAANDYTYYSALTANVYAGQTYNVSLQAGGTTSTYAQQFRIWIDYNRDGVFSAAESVYVSTASTFSPSVTTGTITIPQLSATVLQGVTRMRVASKFSSAPTATESCTGSGAYGEFEDYNINIQPLPGCSGTPVAGSISASSTSVCVSGSVVLTASGYDTLATGLTYQWYNSAGPIAAATGFTYTTPVLTASETYYFRVTCSNGGAFSNTTPLVINVNNPAVVNTTPATRCGAGTVTLSGVGSSGTFLSWYGTATGGAVLASGNSFVTPVINATTTYYVEADTYGTGSAQVGAGNLTGTVAPYSFGNGGYGGMKGQYLVTAAELTAAGIKAGNLNSVAFDVSATGSALQGFTVQIGSTALTEFVTPVSIVGGLTTVVNSATFTPVVGINTLNFTTPFVWDGTSNIVVSTSWSNNNASNTSVTVRYNATTNYSSQSYRKDNETPANMLAFSGATGTGTFAFDRSQNRPKLIFGGSNVLNCQSARTAVVATVNTAPALTLSSTAATLCAGSTSPVVNVTSNQANFDTYVWSPATNVSGSLAGGFTFNPAATTAYTLTASQSGGSQCTASVVYTVTVNPLPPVITAAPATSTICVGNTVALSVSGASNGSVTVGTGTASNPATGTTATAYPAPYGAYYENAKQQYLIRASELTALGLSAGSAISSLAFNVTTVGTSGIHTAYTVSIGNTAQNAIATFESGLTQVFGPVNYQPVNGLNTHVFTTPFVWNGTSNIVVQVCHSNDTTGAGTFFTSNAQSTYSVTTFNSSLTYRVDNIDACGASTITYTEAERPNMTFTYSSGDVTWAPVGGLYTDAAATIAYTGTPATTVYAKPTSSAAYVATITTAASCTRVSNTVTVNVNQNYPFYADADGDGYGTGAPVSVCAVNATTPPAGYALNNTDCNDNNSAVYQSATLYVDADGDGYSSGVSQVVCYGATIPAGYVANATAIDCNDTVAAINPGHAEVLYNGVDDNCDGQLDEGFRITTSLLPASCGTTLASIGSLIGITTLAPGSAYTGWRIRLTNGAQVQIIEKNVPHFTLPEFPSYAYATTYTVEIELQRNGVWLGYYGPACLVSTPAILEEGGASSVSPSQCGITLPKINTLIATTSLQGVTGYRFKVTNLTDPLGPNAVQTIDRTQNWFSLPMLTRYNYGTTYRIEIAVKTTGAYGGFGAPCEVSSPPAPSLINCGGIAASGTSTVAATSVQGATQYRFQITRQSDLASATIDRSTNYFIFNSVPASAFTPGALYGIRVAVMTSGFWSPFGDACEYTAPGGTSKGAGSDAAAVASEFRATAYPNPFTSDFGIDVISSSQDNVQVRVYDMLGKLIEDRSVRLQELSLEKVGAQYPSGVYNVIVTQGEIVKTLRVIKR